ncbi:DUF4157 domain-containing protein [candidate division KSB1 bacterium]|nr:DUF4157 domain-containing protein [candidate division KSB1 bacterium]RQW07343.1 MAG: DUF4157 domain-containing protein [candidate division KSB1 bacterium]
MYTTSSASHKSSSRSRSTSSSLNSVSRKAGDADVLSSLIPAVSSNDHSQFTRPNHTTEHLSRLIQPKMEVGAPNDRFEQEADSTAEKVMSSPLSAASGLVQRAGEEEEKQPVQTSRLARQSEEKKEDFVQEKPQVSKQEEPEREEAPQMKPNVQPQEEEEREEMPQTKPLVQKQDEMEREETLRTKPDSSMTEEKEPVQTKLSVQGQEEEEERPQTKSSSSEEEKMPVMTKGESSGSPSSNFESTLNATKAGGAPLPHETRSYMEPRFGSDFGGVKVHTDATAAQMNQDLKSQAFTHGSHIYFAEGKYNPGTSTGKNLIAHELTHTIQQTGGISRTIQRSNGGTQTQSTAGDPEAALRTLNLPAVKSRHQPLYSSWAGMGKLKRQANYARGNPNQKRIWNGIEINRDKLKEKFDLEPGFRGRKTITGKDDRLITGTFRQLEKKLLIPSWDRHGNHMEYPFEVDHIIELQAGGWPGSTDPNTLPNMELLDKSSNASAGSSVRNSIRNNVVTYLQTTGQEHTNAKVNDYLAQNDIVFNQVVISGRDSGESQYWTQDEIREGVQLEGAQVVENVGEAGTPEQFALVNPDATLVLAQYPHAPEATVFPVEGPVLQKKIRGFIITQISLNPDYATAQPGSQIGTASAQWDLPEKFEVNDRQLQLNIVKTAGGQYMGALETVPSLGGDAKGASPFTFPEINIGSAGLEAIGQLNPTIPLLSSAPIEIILDGNAIRFQHTFEIGEVNVPLPGVTIYDSSLTLFFDTEQGLGAGGTVAFGIERVGEGRLSAEVSTSGNMEFDGQFDFDTELFNPARIRVFYRNESFGVEGTIGIPRNKVRGIKRATIQANYSEGNFSAQGSAELDIPGIERGEMSVSYSNDAFSIGGKFSLSSDIPGIKSGEVEAQVSKVAGEEGYQVSVTGTAQPDIPGLDTTLTISYVNGIIKIEGSASYSRGMLSGNVTVGVTNQPVGEDGQPTGEPSEQLRAYGGGELTLQLTPWLQATAGVRLTPQGEIEVRGEIGLPNAVEIFPRKSIEKRIFRLPTLEIPLFAIPLGPRSIGLVATISGGLDAEAGIGPGQITDLSVGVTYNPAHEENTTITGRGRFVIPANAGLRLFARAGIGISIGIARVSGNLEIGAGLGLEGAAEAGVNVNWSPAAGLELNAYGQIYVQPKFKFDVSAVLEASLLFLSKEWRHTLAEFEYGPDLRFGVRFPIHYKEGEPFDISLDDVQFETPNVDIMEIVRGLGRKILD